MEKVINPKILSKHYRILLNAYKLNIRDVAKYMPIGYKMTYIHISQNNKPLDERFINALIKTIKVIKGINIKNVDDLINQAIKFENMGVPSILQRNYLKRQKNIPL